MNVEREFSDHRPTAFKGKNNSAYAGDQTRYDSYEI